MRLCCSGSRWQLRLDRTCLESLLLPSISHLGVPCVSLFNRGQLPLFESNTVFSLIWPSKGYRGKVSTVSPTCFTPIPEDIACNPLPPHRSAWSPKDWVVGWMWEHEVKQVFKRRIEVTKFGLEDWHPLLVSGVFLDQTLNFSCVFGFLSLKWGNLTSLRRINDTVCVRSRANCGAVCACGAVVLCQATSPVSFIPRKPAGDGNGLDSQTLGIPSPLCEQNNQQGLSKTA